MLDIDRQRQRISLGLKQTQEDPWQRVVDTYNVGDELEGTVTKVVTFGAFVEILDGVEGLVHISELAQHHVENPREIIQPGDPVRVKILEIDSERRRLSLSIKRVEGQVLPVRPIMAPTDGDAGDLDDVPELGLSEDVFAGEEQLLPAEHRPATVGGRRPGASAEPTSTEADTDQLSADADRHCRRTTDQRLPADADQHCRRTPTSVCRPTPTARATPRPRPRQRWAPPTSYRKLGRTPDAARSRSSG